MGDENKSDSSTSESDVSHCSSTFNPMKALYSSKTKVPVETAPMYENLAQFEAARKTNEIIPYGEVELVRKRREEKERKRIEEERLLEEKNRQRFARFEAPGPSSRREFKTRNVLTRMETLQGPMAVLKECVDKRLRIKIITRNDRSVRGVLYATLVAFDKQWNFALSDVLEVWKRKAVKKRKAPPGFGTPVPKGTAAKISSVPEVTETPLGNGIWECTRYIPQIMIRGEHVVLVNIVD